MRRALLICALVLSACPPALTGGTGGGGSTGGGTGGSGGAGGTGGGMAGGSGGSGGSGGGVAGGSGGSGGADGGTGLVPCLERPTDLPRPPGTKGLPCELLPPGFKP